jgi:hypothetical protein
MKFHSVDTGNCRVYYRAPGGRLHCIQDETAWGLGSFKFYQCSRDGEPSHEVAHKFTDLAAEFAARRAEHTASFVQRCPPSKS